MKNEKKMILEFYKDEVGQYRWRIKARNGRIMADCAESYTRPIDCTKACRNVLKKIGSGWWAFNVKWHTSIFKER